MGATKADRSKKKKTIVTDRGEVVEVLYQKMGDRWFAFSLIDDEVFVGTITQEEIDAGQLRADGVAIQEPVGNEGL